MHRMLRGLGFKLVRRRNIGHQSYMNVHNILRAVFQLHLTGGFKERQTFNIAYRAAYFYDYYIGLLLERLKAELDFVGDMRNNLHGCAQIFATAFAFYNTFVNAARRDDIILGHAGFQKPFVITQVKVGFRAVLGDENLTVLIGRHRAGIDIDIRIELLHKDFQTAVFQQSSQRRGCDSFAETGHDSAGHKDKFCLLHRLSPRKIKKTKGFPRWRTLAF